MHIYKQICLNSGSAAGDDATMFIKLRESIESVSKLSSIRWPEAKKVGPPGTS